VNNANYANSVLEEMKFAFKVAQEDIEQNLRASCPVASVNQPDNKELFE